MHRVEERGKRHSRFCSAAAISAVALALLALASAWPVASGAASIEYELTIGVAGHGQVMCRVGAEPLGACATEYPEGTEVDLMPVADANWEFEEWGGACEGQAEECALTIEEDQSVTATFGFEPSEYPLYVDTLGGTGYGDVECKVAGGELETCEAEYLEGTKVTLVVTEVAEGSKFVEWKGDCSGATGCSVTMNGPRSVTAVFNLKEFLLTVGTAGKGVGEFRCEAEEGEEECRSKYPWETEVTVLPKPAAGSVFTGFSGDCQGTTQCEVEMTEPHKVTVAFGLVSKSKFTLEVDRAGSGSGTVTSVPSGIACGGTCSAKFEEGAEVTLTAAPSAGSELVSWDGCASQPEPDTCEVAMSAAKKVTTTFDLKPMIAEYTLEVKKGGAGSGSVSSSPSGIDCGPKCSASFIDGTKVSLTPSADVGSEFRRWLGGGCGTEQVCTTTMGASKNVEAVFGEAAPPPPSERSGKVRVVTRSAAVRGGRALLVLRCSGGPCKGHLQLIAAVRTGKGRKNLAVGSLSFELAAGGQRAFRVRLSAPLARRELARRGTLGILVRGSGVVSSRLELRRAQTMRG